MNIICENVKFEVGFMWKNINVVQNYIYTKKFWCRLPKQNLICHTSPHGETMFGIQKRLLPWSCEFW